MKEVFLQKKAVIKLEQEWLAAQIAMGVTCRVCKSDKNLTYDHIIPRMILSMFGYETERYFNEDNSTVLCRRCNNFKSARLDFSFPKTKELLQKFLDKV